MKDWIKSKKKRIYKMSESKPNKRGRPAKVTIDQISEALEQSAGIFSGAAKMLGTCPNTISNKVRKSKKLRDLVAEIKYKTLDLAETELLKKLKEGNMTAIIFYLKTQGKDRGYVERVQEQAVGRNGDPVDVDRDLLTFTDAELRSIIAKVETNGFVVEAKKIANSE